MRLPRANLFFKARDKKSILNLMKRAVLAPLSGAISIGVLFLAGCVGTQDPAPVSMYGSQPGAGSSGVHTVTSGETLWNISNRYNVVMRDIVASNNLSAPFVLSTGQRLKLPPPREYRVHNGDTLYNISRLFAVSSTEIARLNHMQAPYSLQVGQVLKLPSPAAAAPAPVQVAMIQPQAVKPVPKPEELAPAAGAAQSTRYVGALPEQLNQQASMPQPAPKATPAVVQGKITAQTPSRASSKFLRPVSGRVISSYGSKADGLHNDGINIQAAKGTPVQAAENGVVVYAGNALKGSGNLVLIRHADRWMTAYAHMDEIKVTRGAVIKRGQVIGTVGSTGSVDQPQLHFEVRRGTDAINPSRYLES